jgi:hypothetical protein
VLVVKDLNSWRTRGSRRKACSGTKKEALEAAKLSCMEGEEITSGFLDFIIRGNCITRSVFDFNVKNRHNLQIL